MLRKIPKESLDEIKAIFDVTGATERMNTVEEVSRRKAEEMGLDMDEYCKRAFNYVGKGHTNE